MIKFENNKATIEGTGEDLLLEFGKNDDEKAAFKAGLDAPLHKTKKDDEPDFIKMLDDLIESIKKGD